MSRISATLATLLSLLCAAALAQERPAAAPAAAPPPPLQGPRDEPLGHVQPGVGERMQAIMQEEVGEEAAHQGLLGRRLHGRGPVRFEYLYTGEVFSNARGGIDTNDATQYEGLFSLGMLIDLEETHPALPGRFFMLTQNTHGRGMTDDFVGDAQVLSNIDSFRNIMQVSEYFWEVDFLDERCTLRLGKQDINGEFMVVDMAGDFIQSSFGISPTLAVPTYPNPSAAAVLLARVTDTLDLKAGVWDGVPHGGNWGFSGTGITLAIGELDYRYALAGGTLPGSFAVGIGYVSAGYVGAGEFHPQAYGVYGQLEQWLWRENPYAEDDEQGIGVFFQYGPNFPRDVVKFKDYFGAGLVYKGPIPGRDEDIFGAGVAHALLNFGGTGRETVIEVFYKAHLTPWATVQPDLQYVASPSGLYRDSLVVGLRFEVLL